MKLPFETLVRLINNNNKTFDKNSAAFDKIYKEMQKTKSSSKKYLKLFNQLEYYHSINNRIIVENEDYLKQLQQC